jgi:hypothetical protein
MNHFDTLIWLDTLIFSLGAGSNRQIITMEVKAQHDKYVQTRRTIRSLCPYQIL